MSEHDHNPEAAERVREMITDDEVLSCIHSGGKPPHAMLDAALEDAEHAVAMFGAAMLGADELYGGQPSDRIVANWTHMVQHRVQVARALAALAAEAADA